MPFRKLRRKLGWGRESERFAAAAGLMNYLFTYDPKTHVFHPLYAGGITEELLMDVMEQIATEQYEGAVIQRVAITTEEVQGE